MHFKGHQELYFTYSYSKQEDPSNIKLTYLERNKKEQKLVKNLHKFSLRKYFLHILIKIQETWLVWVEKHIQTKSL